MVEKLQRMGIFIMAVVSHLGFEGQNGCQSSKVPPRWIPDPKISQIQ